MTAIWATPYYLAQWHYPQISTGPERAMMSSSPATAQSSSAMEIHDLLQKGRSSSKLVERSYPHRVEMIVPEGNFGRRLDQMTSGSGRVVSRQSSVAAGVTRTTAIM